MQCEHSTIIIKFSIIIFIWIFFIFWSNTIYKCIFFLVLLCIYVEHKLLIKGTWACFQIHKIIHLYKIFCSINHSKIKIKYKYTTTELKLLLFLDQNKSPRTFNIMGMDQILFWYCFFFKMGTKHRIIYFFGPEAKTMKHIQKW